MDSIFFMTIVLAIVIGIIAIYKIVTTKSSKPYSTPSKIIRSSEPKKGVQVDVLKEGSGNSADPGRKVWVHYNAWLTNGTKVDSSYDKGEEFSFIMGKNQVIPGWEAGMLGMKEGEKRKFTISPDQAYGDKGKADVPPNAIIIFEVDLLKVV